MPLVKYSSKRLTPTDVISYEDAMFSRHVKYFPKSPAVEPGIVIDDAGVIVSTASTSANVVLEYRDASAGTIGLLCVNSHAWIKKFALQASDVNKAVQLLTQDKTILISDAPIDGLPQTS